MEFLNATSVSNTSEGKTPTKTADETLTYAFNVVRIIILIIGTIGNVLTLITMTRSSLKKLPTCFYLTIVAVAGGYELLIDL